MRGEFPSRSIIKSQHQPLAHVPCECYDSCGEDKNIKLLQICPLSSVDLDMASLAQYQLLVLMLHPVQHCNSERYIAEKLGG